MALGLALTSSTPRTRSREAASSRALATLFAPLGRLFAGREKSKDVVALRGVGPMVVGWSLSRGETRGWVVKLVDPVVKSSRGYEGQDGQRRRG